MSARGSSARSARRASTAAAEPARSEFEEPAIAPESHLGLKTTGQSLADSPDEDALPAIEDPERMRRQQARGGTSRVQRRAHRATTETQDSDAVTRANRERLFLRLKRNLVTSPDEPLSGIRQSPTGEKEDYRHDRQIAESGSGRRRPRRAASAHFAPVTRRSRRSRVSNSNGGAYDDKNTSLESSEIAPESQSPKRRNKRVKTEHTEETSHQKLSFPHAKAESSEESSTHGAEVEFNEPKPKLETNKKDLLNNDFCNSCGGTGELVCCETCIRSFHFSCIEPPVMDVSEIQEEEWSCRSCKPVPLTNKEQKEVAGTLFEPLIVANTSHNAVAFQLPTNLREMFAHVEATKYGEYVDEAAKTPHAPPVHRIQDKDGAFYLCFKCKGNGLNDRHLAVCSTCQEPWHIDCLDPPLESTPFGHWVCPLHAGRSIDMPLRVKAPQITPVRLTRHIRNNGDIEIEESDDDFVSPDDETLTGSSANGDSSDSSARKGFMIEGLSETEKATEISRGSEPPNERIVVADSYEGEEVTKNVHFPAQTRAVSDGSIVAKIVRHRPRGYEQDRIVHRIPTRTIKLDFLDAVEKLRSQPYRETPTSDFMLGLNLLADKPQKDCDAVRNLMLLGVSGPTVSTARAKDNLDTLVDAALDDDNEIGQIAAIRKLMKEKGKERLLEILQTI